MGLNELDTQIVVQASKGLSGISKYKISFSLFACETALIRQIQCVPDA